MGPHASASVLAEAWRGACLLGARARCRVDAGGVLGCWQNMIEACAIAELRINEMFAALNQTRNWTQRMTQTVLLYEPTANLSSPSPGTFQTR